MNVVREPTVELKAATEAVTRNCASLAFNIRHIATFYPESFGRLNTSQSSKDQQSTQAYFLSLEKTNGQPQLVSQYGVSRINLERSIQEGFLASGKLDTAHLPHLERLYQNLVAELDLLYQEIKQSQEPLDLSYFNALKSSADSIVGIWQGSGHEEIQQKSLQENENLTQRYKYILKEHDINLLCQQIEFLPEEEITRLQPEAVEQTSLVERAKIIADTITYGEFASFQEYAFGLERRGDKKVMVKPKVGDVRPDIREEAPYQVKSIVGKLTIPYRDSQSQFDKQDPVFDEGKLYCLLSQTPDGKTVVSGAGFIGQDRGLRINPIHFEMAFNDRSNADGFISLVTETGNEGFGAVLDAYFRVRSSKTGKEVPMFPYFQEKYLCPYFPFKKPLKTLVIGEYDNTNQQLRRIIHDSRK